MEVGLFFAALVVAVAAMLAQARAQGSLPDVEAHESAGIRLEVERGTATAVHLQVSQAAHRLPDDKARAARRLLWEGGASLSMNGALLSVAWPDRRPLSRAILEQVATAAALYVPAEKHLRLPLDTSPLVALSVGLEHREAVQDLAWMTGGGPEIRRILGRLEALSARLGLEPGQLLVDWEGLAEHRDEVVWCAHALREALSAVPSEPWTWVRDQLDSPVSAVRERLFEMAERSSGPLRKEVAAALLTDPDLLLAWRVARQHGQVEDWLAMLHERALSQSMREEILTHMYVTLTDEQRAQAAAAVAANPMLRGLASELLTGLKGEAAEDVWIALAEVAEEPALVHQIALGLSEVGTRRCLPALYALQESLSPLQFQLKAQVAQALAEVRSRSGGVGGALSLAEPAAGQGGLSVAAEPGRLSLSKEGPPR